LRDDEFFIPAHHRTELERLLSVVIPSRIEDLEVTTARQDRITRPAFGGKRGKPESRPPLNMHGANAAHQLRAALVGAVRLTCEHRGIDYDGDPSTLGLCAWLRRNITALALTPGANDAHADILAAVTAATRAVDIPKAELRYVGPCRACSADLYAHHAAIVYRCACGNATPRDLQDADVNTELEARNYTAAELVTIVRDRLGMRIRVKTIYDLEYRKTEPVSARGYRMRRGRREKMYNAGDVFAALRVRTAA
jgi:hypothetical protein